MQFGALSAACRRALPVLLLVLLAVASSTPLLAQQGGEAALKLPDLNGAVFLNGSISGPALLKIGLAVSALGFVFALMMYTNVRNLAVHESMLEISELIYETCKTYLITQGKFLAILELFIGAVIVLYFGVLSGYEAIKVVIILAFSVVGIIGSYGVAWFGIRVNTFANSRTAFASLRGKPFPCYQIPLQGRHEHRHAADQRRTVPDAVHSAVHSRRLCGALLHRICDRGIAGRGGVARRRRHFHQDRRHRRRSDENRFQDQRGRRAKPRRDRRLHRRQRGRFGGTLGRRF